MKNINCSNPVLILNPSIVDLVCRSLCFYIDGRHHTITSSERFDVISGESASKVFHFPFVRQIVRKKEWSDSEYEQCILRQENFLDNSYFVSDSGEILGNIWVKVPCGKCDVCVSSKVSSFVQRAKFAQEESKVPAIFFTLTYNNAHLPENSVCNRKDLQLFMKKLKSCLRRFPEKYIADSASQVKWIYASEYGLLGRPHYHCILFGLPNLCPDNPTLADFRLHWLLYYSWRESERLDNGQYRSFKSYCETYSQVYNRKSDYDSFSKGFVNVDVMASSKAVSYVLKYAFKLFGEEDEKLFAEGTAHFEVEPFETSSFKFRFDVSEPKKPVFYGCSQCLGVEFVKQYKDFISSSLDGKFRYISFFDNTLKEVNLSSYYLKKLFPSKSNFIPVELRKSFNRLICFGNDILNSEYCNNKIAFGVIQTLHYAEILFPYLSFNYYADKLKNHILPHNRLVSDVFEENDLVFSYPKIEVGSFGSAGDFNNLLDSFMSDFGYLVEHQIDYDKVQDELNKRNLFFSKFQERSQSQIDDVGKEFRKTRIKHMSNKKLF